MATPGVRRVLDRLADLPVLVVDVAWNPVERNAPAAALLGEVEGEQNLVRRQFLGLPDRVVRDAAETAALEAWLVDDLHRSLARLPGHAGLRELVPGLMRDSERFRSLWKVRPSDGHAPVRETFAHPVAGELTLDRDLVRVEGDDARLLVWSADPATLARLG